MIHSCQVCFRPGLEPEESVALANGYRHKECPRLEAGDFHPFEHHRMPNGSEVYYRDSDHSYYGEVKPVFQGRGEKKGRVAFAGVGATEMSSPSSIAKYADPNPDLLMGYVERVQRGDLKPYEVELLANAEELGVDTTQPNYNILRDCKGEVGNIAHAASESILRGEEIPPFPSVAQGYVDGVIAFYADLGNFEVLQQEAVVYSAEHGYAGRFDARLGIQIAKHTESSHHETWLVDLKTSGFIGRAYHNQLAGYDLAAEECGYGASDRLIILQVTEEGRYVPWPCRGTREGFLHNLASFKDGKRMDALTRKDYAELAA